MNGNENPYGPSPGVLAAANFASTKSAYYQSSLLAPLKEKIAAINGIDTDLVTVSSGSNEGLCAAMAVFGRKGPIIAPALTYWSHLDYARRIGVEVKTVEMTDTMDIDLDRIARVVTPSTGLVYICNPNNPTGIPINSERLRDFCRSVSKVTPVLVDEAYNNMMDDPESNSMMDLVRDGKNVIVVRTFSKLLGMAGFRIGYSMGKPELLKPLTDHLMAWLNAPGMAAATAALDDTEFPVYALDKIIRGREMVTKMFNQHGLSPLPSVGNFLFTDIGRDTKLFYEQMRAKGIVVGDLFPNYPTWFRVSMGKHEELKQFSRVFSEVYTGRAAA